MVGGSSRELSVYMCAALIKKGAKDAWVYRGGCNLPGSDKGTIGQ